MDSSSTLTAERALLSALLAFPHCIPSAIKLVTATDFFSEDHHHLFATIKHLHECGLPIEISAIAISLKHRRSAVDEAVSLLEIATTGETASYYARQVRSAAKARQRSRLAHQFAAKPDDKGLAEQLRSALEPEPDNRVEFDLAKLPTGADLQKMEVTVEYLVDGILPKQAIIILHGRGGIGKTWLAFQIAEAVATGTPFIGNITQQVPVIYIDFENPSPVLVDRTRALNIQHVRFWHISNTDQPPPHLDSPEVTLLESLPSGSLIIIDTLRSSHLGDENDSRDIAAVLATLKHLREKGFTLLLLHHTAKGNNQKYKGSTAILDLADHELNLCEADKKEGEQDHYFKLHTPQKSRYQTDELTLDFDLDQGGFFIVPNEADLHIKTIYQMLIDAPEDLRKKTRLVERIKTTGISKNQARKLLDKGAGKFWSTESRPGEKNSVIYTANPDFQFSDSL
jgi:hypothetical protein